MISNIRLLLFSLLLLAYSQINAQQLYRVSTIWSDDYNEWEIETDSIDLFGYFKNPRPFVKIASFWRFELGQLDGTIQLKDEYRHRWELESRNRRITFYPVYRNDLRSWRFIDENNQLVFESRWKQRFDEWLYEKNKDRYFYMYTDMEFNPSDWHIEDTLNDHFSMELKLALTFCCIYNTVPKVH